MYKFSVVDLSGAVIYSLRYWPNQEPQFMQLSGDNHSWTWDMFNGSLLKDGGTDLIDGGWSIQIERWIED